MLLALDLGLFAASATKFVDGGWLPAGIAIVLMIVFSKWRRGRQLLTQRLAAEAMPLEVFLKSTAKAHRVVATADYLTSNRDGVPPALLHNLNANQVRHERILLVTVETVLMPFVDAAERATETLVGEGLSRVLLRYGFAERPDIPAALRALPGGCDERATYFLSRQTLVPSARPGMARWRESLFAVIVRGAETPMSFFRLPINRVVELGSQVEI